MDAGGSFGDTLNHPRHQTGITEYNMKISNITTLFTAALALGLLAGCSPDTGPVGEPFTITITGDDRMRFDPTEFTVQARQPVTIVFQNIGVIPKESMGHNLVVLRLGVDKIEFANAGAVHVRNEYIDPARQDYIIAATRILGPGEQEEISFVAPAERGNYDYVCTFPGHTPAGMVGVMTVE
jgi:azurin